MENIMSVEEKNKIINMYSVRLSRSTGSLGRYYAEIVDNMTYEDTKKLLELGTKYGFEINGDSFKDAFKVIAEYVAIYFRACNLYAYKKDMADFGGNYYNYLCAKIEYYGNLIEELSTKNSVSSIIVNSVSKDVSEKYPEFLNLSLLNNLNIYLIENANDLLRSKYDGLYNALADKKRGLDIASGKSYCLKKTFGIKIFDPHYISDNHVQ